MTMYYWGIICSWYNVLLSIINVSVTHMFFVSYEPSAGFFTSLLGRIFYPLISDLVMDF